MDRRSLLQGLAGFGLPDTQQKSRKLEKLARYKVEGECPVCKSQDVLDKFDAVTPKYQVYDGAGVTLNDDLFYRYTPAPMLEVACGQCGVCYLTKNPKAK